MNGLLIALVPTALMGALAPVLVLPVLLLLGTKRAIPNALAYTAAALCLYTVIGVIGIVYVGGHLSASESDLSKVSATVSLVLGIVALLFAVQQWRSGPGKETWIAQRVKGIQSIAPGKACGLGLAMPLFGAKNLIIYIACLNLIGAARLGIGDSLIAMSVILCIFAPQMIIPIVLYAMVAERAAPFLDAIQNWLVKHNRAIGIGASVVIGLMMLSQGLSGLALIP